MGFWIFSLLTRIASGEHYRKATPAERRWYFSGFMFLPVFAFCVGRFGNSYLRRAGPVGVWFFMMAFVLIFGAILVFWTRYIPAIVSLILGVGVWGVTIWMSITGRLF
jgi:hypothetical protein